MSAVAASAKNVTWKDAPNGRCWVCQTCRHATVSGQRAADHAMETQHGLPWLSFATDEVLEAAQGKKTTVLAVRAGDYVQAGDDLRLALEVANTAIALAQRHGAPADTTNRLQAIVKRLQAS